MITRTPALYHLSLLVNHDEQDAHLIVAKCGAKASSDGKNSTFRNTASLGWADLLPVSRSLDDGSYPDNFRLRKQEPQGWLAIEIDDRFDYITQRQDYPRVASPAQENKKKARRAVSFSQVEILEYSVVLGDHPCTPSLAISLGWEHAPLPIVTDINDYELLRARYRRKGTDLQLSYYERKNVLKNVGGLKETDIIRDNIQRRRANNLNKPSYMQSVMLI